MPLTSAEGRIVGVAFAAFRAQRRLIIVGKRNSASNARGKNKETIAQARRPLRTGYDAVHGTTGANRTGFHLRAEDLLFGPSADAFGQNGQSWSCHGACPTEGIGFSFAMNHMPDDRSGDQRAKRILESVYGSNMKPLDRSHAWGVHGEPFKWSRGALRRLVTLTRIYHPRV